MEESEQQLVCLFGIIAPFFSAFFKFLLNSRFYRLLLVRREGATRICFASFSIYLLSISSHTDSRKSQFQKEEKKKKCGGERNETRRAAFV